MWEFKERENVIAQTLGLASNSSSSHQVLPFGILNIQLQQQQKYYSENDHIHQQPIALQVEQYQSSCPVDLDMPERLYVRLSTFWYCFLALITTIGLLVSLISNMVIIYLFTRTPSLRRNPSNIIAANLSLSDLLYCSQWPSVIYCSLTQSTWILESEFVCQSFGFITVSTALASILTVLVMSVERAIVIIYSIQAKNRFTIRSAWLIILLIWLICLASCLPPLFGKFNRYTLDPSKTSCTLDYLSRKANYKFYILVLYVAYWIAPTIIISISYILIIATFKKSSLSLRMVSDEPVESVHLSTSSSVHSNSVTWRAKRRLRDSIRLNTFMSGFHRQHSSSASCRGAGSGNRNGNGNGNGASVRGWLRSAYNGQSGQNRGAVSSSRPQSVRRYSAGFVELDQLRDEYQSSQFNQHSSSTRQPAQPHRSAALKRFGAFRRIASSSLLLSLRSSEEWNGSANPPKALNALGPYISTVATQVTQHNTGNNSRQQLVQTNSNSSQRLQPTVSNETIGTSKTPQMQAKRSSKGSNLGDQTIEVSAIATSSTATNTPNKTRGHGFATTSGRNWRSTKATNATGSSQAANSQLTRTVLQFRLAKMSFYLILLWLVSWTPIASLAMLNSVVKCHRASATAVFMASTMTKLGPAFDVFIYGISHPKIKSKFKQIIKRLFMIPADKAKTNRPGETLQHQHHREANENTMHSNFGMVFKQPSLRRQVTLPPPLSPLVPTKTNATDYKAHTNFNSNEAESI